jgi:hypothetical protein
MLENFINQKFDYELKKQKKKIKFNEQDVSKIELTDNEIFMLKYAIVNKEGKLHNVIFFPLSPRLHLDFVSWNSCDEVLLCLSNKRRNKLFFNIKH